MALSERVNVLQDGTYLGPNLKAFASKAGAVIEVLGGWYPAALVEAGMVERSTKAGEPAAVAEDGEPAGQVLADPADTVRLDQLEPAKQRKARIRA